MTYRNFVAAYGTDGADGRRDPVAPMVQLTDGAQMPAIGLGTYPMLGDAAQVAVRHGLCTGYRLVDTASKYDNEQAVGRGIAESGVAREEVFLTTKLRGSEQGYDETLAAVDGSCQRLGVDYLDLFMIHWPMPHLDKYVESWRAMVKLHDDGVVKSIGVTNFTAEHLDRLLDETGVMPVVNQIELHPYFSQDEMRAVNAERGVRTESYSPLGRGSRFETEPAIQTAAQTYGMTPAQVVLRWHIQLGAIPIPKSADAQRQRENLSVFDFELTGDEMAAITALHGPRLGDDPETYEEF
jgi:2,5-diketo-D-gluconate reductase A